MATGPWLTTEQVAEHYQLPVSTIRQRIRRGLIKARNFGTDRKPMYRVHMREIRRIDAA